MLQDKLYNIADIKVAKDTIDAAIQLDESHPVFKGHFPGNPVLPGVCALQILKEILSASLHKCLQISIACDIKFLQMIDPVRNNSLEVKIRYVNGVNEEINIQGTILQENKICFKIDAVFVTKGNQDLQLL